MKGPLFYAGIGSRETPDDICEYMTQTAVRLAKIGFILRSGGAAKADTAFENGAGKAKVILKTKDATPDAIGEAARHHPAWHRCDQYAQRLHGRNVMIVLGEDNLSDQEQWVKFVICWTPPDVARGGTKLGMRVAEENKIPVFNLAVPGRQKDFELLLSGLEIDAS